MFQFQRRIVCVDDSAYSFGGGVVAREYFLHGLFLIIL